MTCTIKVGVASPSGSRSYAMYLAASTLTIERDNLANYYYAPEVDEDDTTIRLRPDLSPEFARVLGVDVSRGLTLAEVANLLNNERADGGPIEGQKIHSGHQSVAEVFGLSATQMPSVEQIEHVLGGRRVDGEEPRSNGGNHAPLSDERVASALRQFKRAIGVQPDRDATPEEIARVAVGKIDALDYRKQITATAPPTAYVDLTLSVGKTVAIAWAHAPTEAERNIWHGIMAGANADAMGYVQEMLGVARRGAGGLGREEPGELVWMTAAHYTARPAADVVRQDEQGRDFTDWSEVPAAKADPQPHFHNLVKNTVLSETGHVGAVDWSRLHPKVVGAVFHAAISTRARAFGIEMDRGPNGEARVIGIPHWFEVFSSRRSQQGEQAARIEATKRGLDWDALAPDDKIKMLKDGVAEARQDKIKRSADDVESDFAVWKEDARRAGYQHRSTLRPDAIQPELTRAQRIEIARDAAMPLIDEAFKTRPVLAGHQLDEIAARGLIISGFIGSDPPGEKAPLGDVDRLGKAVSEQQLSYREALDYLVRQALREGSPSLDIDAIEQRTGDRLSDAAFRMEQRTEVTPAPSALADIGAVVTTFRERGVVIDGVETRLEWGHVPGSSGRQQVAVTTTLAIAEEQELVGLVRDLAADRRAAMTREQIDRAADRFLVAHPRVDPEGPQWRAQIEMARQIGEGGQFSMSIGVGGSGKTSAVAATLVDAWHAEGRQVFGTTVSWKASAALREAGVDEAVAIEAFLKRVEAGKYQVDRNTVIIADEVSTIPMRQQLALTRLAQRTGAQLVEIGDPRQSQSVETPAIDTIAKALGDEAIPKLLTSIRQKDERQRQIASLFRDGRSVEAVKAMREDGSLHVVAGGEKPVVQRTVELWHTMTRENAADPEYSLLVMTPTNAQARAVGEAIRAVRRDAGEIREDGTVLKAIDPNSKDRQTYDLPVATGDQLRMFIRARDTETGAWLANNGDVVEVRKVEEAGLRIRNAEGAEGMVRWAQMKPWRAPVNDPVRLTYGYAVTIDTAQSMTVRDALLSMPDGSRQVTGFKAHTAGSRQERSYHVVVSDAAERREIVARQPHGMPGGVPDQADVIRNLAVNLGRFETRRQASDVLTHTVGRMHDVGASLQRGTMTVAQEQPERMLLRTYALQRLTPVMERVIEYARELSQRLAHRQEQTIDREQGRYLGLSR